MKIRGLILNSQCPFCYADLAEADTPALQENDDTAWREQKCPVCKAEWHEQYQLISIIVYAPGTEGLPIAAGTEFDINLPVKELIGRNSKTEN